MFIDKVVRNVYSIGGGITVSAFGVSLISSRVSAPKFDYPTTTGREFSGTVKTINDIEDLEYIKGCKFYFYDKNLVSQADKFKISRARDFAANETNKSEMFENVKKKIDECVPGRFFYHKI